MSKIRSNKNILLCGIFLLVTTPLCHAQESARLFDVNIPQARMSSASAPNITQSLPSHTQQSKPDKGVAEKSWFRRFLEGIAIGTARYNTEKQDEGRPQPANNSR
jgi:hypothetical protein